VTETPTAVLSENGTRAIEQIGTDETIYIGTTVNAEAVASVLETSQTDIVLVAVGKLGESVPEDVIGAEMIRTYLEGGDIDTDMWSNYSDRIRSSKSAQSLRDVGLESDIETVLEFNSSSIVPVLRSGRFVPIEV